jgi:hypothetical protein
MKYPKKPIKLHNTSSLVKVDRRRERVVESPDELIRLKIKKSDVDWVSGFASNLIRSCSDLMNLISRA